MEFVEPFVGVINQYLIGPLVQRINYLRRCNANVTDMKATVRKLMARRNDEQSTLKAAKDAGKVKTEVASNWFQNVDSIKMEASEIEEAYNQGTCAGGWCVNCRSRYRSSKRSIDLKQKAESAYKDQFVLVRPPSLKPGIERETEPIQNQPSTQHMLQQLLDRIVEPEIGILGVYGMGGVGKTTLAKHVNNHFSNNSCFETVIMVTVSATPNIPNIQTTIGKRLGLDLSKTTDKDNAREKLYGALKRKKFLLILDDVWDKHTIELDDVGIPHPRNHKGSKILITSRSQDACTDMGARETMKVQPLSKVESWNLFVQKAGDHVADDGIRCFAKKIVERCEGLPLAIVTVAHSMANRRGVGAWENAAREMEQSAIDFRGMKQKVFVPLKFSFDRLDDDKHKRIFLYCACFPEDHYIQRDDVLDYCVGEGLVDILGSLTNARIKGEDWIEGLKIACMLEDGEDEGSVRMHDVMRELNCALDYLCFRV